MRGPAAHVMAALMLLLGVAIIVRTLVAGGGLGAAGLLMGGLFVAAGRGGLFPDTRRRWLLAGPGRLRADPLKRPLEAAGRIHAPPKLRKGLGSPALFGIVQGFI